MKGNKQLEKERSKEPKWKGKIRISLECKPNKQPMWVVDWARGTPKPRPSHIPQQMRYPAMIPIEWKRPEDINDINFLREHVFYVMYDWFRYYLREEGHDWWNIGDVGKTAADYKSYYQVVCRCNDHQK
jgi:hypothetical protein